MALAKPRWITIGNSDSSIRMANALACCSPRCSTMRLASHPAACVRSSAVSTLMPTANSTTVPQGKPRCDAFQSSAPRRGTNINATAAIVVDEVSQLCSSFSVVQNPSSASTMASSFHSRVVVGPIDSSCARIVA